MPETSGPFSVPRRRSLVPRVASTYVPSPLFSEPGSRKQSLGGPATIDHGVAYAESDAEYDEYTLRNYGNASTNRTAASNPPQDRKRLSLKRTKESIEYGRSMVKFMANNTADDSPKVTFININ